MEKNISTQKNEVDVVDKKLEPKFNLAELSPHLENFMMEILENISVKVNKLPPD